MTGKQLKNSILQLAIQGKLVPQNPTDEPASALLQRIRKEKEQLVKEKKLKKKDLVTTPISDEEKPFELPKGWEWCRLSELVSILGDGIHGTPQYDAAGQYYFINGNNLDNGVITIKSGTKKCNSEEFEKYKKPLNNHSMLVSINGTIGNYAFYNGESIFLGKSACYFNLMLIEFKSYIKYIIQSKYFLDYALASATGTTIKNVSLKAMNNLLIPLPPLSEQQRIVAKIEELMPLVEEYDKAQTKLDDLNRKLPEALKKSILQEAIMGKLVAQDPNDEPASVLLQRIHKEKEQLVKEKKIILSKPEKGVKKLEHSEYNVPYNWTTCQLVDICRAFGRIGFRGYTKSDLVSGPKYGAISLSPSNMKESGMEYDDCTYITWEKYEESPEIIIENGDILIVKTGSSYGKTALVRNLPHEATINPQIAVIKDIKINSEYLQAFLQSPFARSKYEEFVLGTSIPTFSQLNLLSIEIPLPPLSEQHRIVAKIEELLGVLG